MKKYQIQLVGEIPSELYLWHQNRRINVVYWGVWDNIVSIECTADNFSLLLESLNA